MKNSFLDSFCLLFALVFGVFITTVFFIRMNNPATSYLHSWNQVTTLVHIELINQDFKNFWQPQDVVTRIGWSQANDATRGVRDSRFFIFEEFPLYHFLSALLIRLIGSPEGAGRALSFFFFWFGGMGLFRLVAALEGRAIAGIATLLYLTSFPFLYYGQAIMSDMAMTSVVIWGMYALICSKPFGGTRAVCLSAISLCLAGLLKSYAVIFSPVLPWSSIVGRRGVALIGRDILCAILAAAPTCVWHIYTSYQPGAQETASHSFAAKAAVLIDPSLYGHLFNIYFRYLGYGVGGALLVLLSFRLLPMKNGNVSSLWEGGLPHVITGWLGASLGYLLLTADKLRNHDYYFLILFPPIFFIVAKCIFHFYTSFEPKGRGIVRIIFILTFFVNAIVSGRSLLKATTPNDDVLRCAALIQSHTMQSDLIATKSDLSRYNSLAFYSDRQAINVEQNGYTLDDYFRAGARYLVVNLPRQEYAGLSLPAGEQVARSLLVEEALHDFKGRERMCSIFRLFSRYPASASASASAPSSTGTSSSSGF